MSDVIKDDCLNGNWAIPILFPYWKKARLNEAYDYFNPYVIMKILKAQVDGQIAASKLSEISKEISKRSVIQLDDCLPRQDNWWGKIIQSSNILYEPMFFDIQSNILLLNKIAGRTVCNLNSSWLIFPSYKNDIEDIYTVLKISCWSKFINQILENNWLWPLLLNHIFHFHLSHCRWDKVDVSYMIEKYFAKTFEWLGHKFNRRMENKIHESILTVVDKIIQSQVPEATIVDNLTSLLNTIKLSNNEHRSMEKFLWCRVYFGYLQEKLWDDYWFKNIFILMEWKEPFDYPPEIYDSETNLVQLDFWRVQSNSKILKAYYDWVYMILKSIMNNEFKDNNSIDLNFECFKRSDFWIKRFVRNEKKSYTNDTRDLIWKDPLLRAIQILNNSDFFNQNFEYDQKNGALIITLKKI
jgi:hypothetical protein